MKSNSILPDASCTGCSACASVCPKNAVSMMPDEAGFLHPKIEKALCVDCKLCEKTCPVRHQPKASEHTDAYAACARDSSLLTRSSSGAIFPVLAKHVLNQGGIVFGAAFDEDFTVKHIGIETVEELPKLCSSKYVQSKIEQTFRKAKAALDAGRLVYFSGTPCQIAGLHTYLGRSYDNLVTQDLICHSAPSPEVWKHYLHSLEQQYGGKATSISFRDKCKGWESYRIHITFDNGAEYLHPAAQDPYQRGFIKGLYSRSSCYICPFKGIDRPSDITLADFWGVKNILPEAYNPNGTSLVLLHSEKARKLFGEISSEMQFLPADANAALIFNQAGQIPIKKPKRYREFWKHYTKTDFDKLTIQCCQRTTAERVFEIYRKSIIYRGLRRIVKWIRVK